MSPKIKEYTATGAIIALLLSLLSWLGGQQSVSGQIQDHKQESARIIAELQGHDSLNDQRIVSVEKKLDKIDGKLDTILMSVKHGS